MKVKEMRTKSEKELSTMLIELRTKLSQAHIDMRVKETPNVKQIAAIKRDIARVLTLQRQTQLATTVQAAQPKETENTNE